MSAKTKQKYVYQEHLRHLDSLSPQQMVARVTDSRGSNLMEVLDSEGRVYLASLPSKLRKNIWLKRGSFVLLEPIAEGRKVRAEVVRALAHHHIVELRRQGVWPTLFEDDPIGQNAAATSGAGQGLVAPPLIPEPGAVGGNLNRRVAAVCCESDSSSDSDISPHEMSSSAGDVSSDSEEEGDHSLSVRLVAECDSRSSRLTETDGGMLDAVSNGCSAHAEDVENGVTPDFASLSFGEKKSSVAKSMCSS